jgi:hypothetical protein
MKILLLLLSVISLNLQAKTCKASLKGNLKKQDYNFPFTKVFYPDDLGHSRQASWDGNVVTKKFIPPAPIDIECGKPFFVGSFEPFKGTVMLPPSVTTLPWTTVDWSGNPRVVEPEILYGIGDSYEYPYPAAFINGNDPMVITQPSPDGATDICEFTKISIPYLTQFVQIETDLLTTFNAYSSSSVWGPYRWDNSSVPVGELIQVEIENAEVIISCDATYKYEASFEWPYVIPADDESMCGPGEVHRSMKIEGEFSKTADNKLIGSLFVSKPEVTYSGTVTGQYNGSGFTIPMEGIFLSDAENKKALLPLLEGGDGISWSYVLTCPYGEIKNTLFAAASEYLRIMNNQEVVSSEVPGYLEFDSENDEKVFNVDMGGQGIVTIKRSWKKIELGK